MYQLCFRKLFFHTIINSLFSQIVFRWIMSHIMLATICHFNLSVHHEVHEILLPKDVTRRWYNRLVYVHLVNFLLYIHLWLKMYLNRMTSLSPHPQEPLVCIVKEIFASNYLFIIICFWFYDHLQKFLLIQEFYSYYFAYLFFFIQDVYILCILCF